MSTMIRLAIGLSCALLLWGPGAEAQSPPAYSMPDPNAPAKPLKMLSYVHVVQNLDRSVAFYRDTFGLPVTAAPGKWRSASTSGAGPGSQERSATLALPGTEVGLRLTEFAHVQRVPRYPRNSDAGASTLSITVRDLDATLAAALRAGATVVTVGGKPKELQPHLRLIFLKDPDGFFIELENAGAGASPAQAAGGAVSAHAGFTVLDSAKTETFYRNVLGMEYRPAGDFRSMKAIEELIDVPNIRFRAAFARLPGSSMEWEFLEFQGSGDAHRRSDPQDPGTAAIAMAVADIDASLRSILAGGGEMVAPADKPAALVGGGRAAVVRDPNGILLELVQGP